MTCLFSAQQSQSRLIALLLAGVATITACFAQDRHVVVLVWDGMRPDFISPETTPNLSKLASRGVFFSNHHPVFLSATEVNGTAIATGVYPERSSVVANKEFRPEIDSEKPINIEKPDAIRKGDVVTGGRYLRVPTLAERLHAHDLRTVIAGSKQVALLHDRADEQHRRTDSPILFEGATLPSSLSSTLVQSLGEFPAATKDKTARDDWTTQALIQTLWREGVPAYSLLWLAEPDNTQHNTGPGSAHSLEAIRNSDANLGKVLAELERRGLRDSTDVLVVSDHGFSTIETANDFSKELSTAGFHCIRTAKGGLKAGQVLVVGNGGAILLYVADHDPEISRRLTEHLQQQPWTGVILSKKGYEGTFPLSLAHIESAGAPDLVVSLRWNAGKSQTGAPGQFYADGIERGPGQGQHASLCRYDMHNTLVAAGPDFREGVINPLPSGNIDLAPTILWLLGFKDEALTLNGRVLSEALTIEAPALRSFDVRRIRTSRRIGNHSWEQSILRSSVNGVEYLDEGNGHQD